MKKFLMTLMALFVVSAAMADSYLYIEPISVTQDQLAEGHVTVPVKAHFEGRVSGFQLDMTYPQGITAAGFENGPGMTIPYMNSAGLDKTQEISLYSNEAMTRIVAATMTYGYWYPADGTIQNYGVIKWEPGDYEEMFYLTLNVAPDFEGGDLIIESTVGAGEDARGGTVTDLGQSGQVYTTMCPIEVIPAPIEATPMPEIMYYCDEDFCTIEAIGEGEVHLYIDDVEVENPYMISRLYGQDQTFIAAATAQIEGWLISEVTMMEVTVPGRAKRPVPAPVLTYTIEDDRVIVNIEWPESDGNRKLYIDGWKYDASVTTHEFYRLDDDQEISIVAYVLEGETYAASEVLDYMLTVPALVQLYAPIPTIECTYNDDAAIITAAGEGEIHLYIDGQEVENPCVLPRGDVEYQVEVTAIARIDGMIDGSYSMTLIVPAKEVVPDPVPGFSLTMADGKILHGQTIVIPVSMTNSEAVTAFQTDLCLPEGFELQDAVLSDRKADHQLLTSNRADGSVRLLCYSPTLYTFEGNEGELLYITVKTPDNASGDYTLELKKNLLTLAGTYDEVRCDDTDATLTVMAYILGDVNGDGVVTVTDVVLTVQRVLDLNPDPFIFDAADVNRDGDITVTDVVLIARMVLYPELVDMMRAPALGEITDAMSGNAIDIMPGETRTVTIALDNDIDYTAFQLDVQLPDGMSASNFSLTDRAGSHTLNTNMMADGSQRVMCYSPMLTSISGNEGALLTFEVTAAGSVSGDIMIDGIEMVSAACQTVNLDSFAIQVNAGAITAVKEMTQGLRIYTDGNNIIVESPISQRIIISDVAGRSYSVDVTEGRHVIPARNSGVVIVTGGGKTAKLMIN